MKAKIWKDRQTGVWCFAISRKSPPWRPIMAGHGPTWEQALSAALAEIGAQRAARM